uniref:G-protein coupled receptors family 3 profile domain-containing protein n=1 Tax=Ciona savignyi TaxID=51511 RepID=H2YQW7_CIOSA
PPLITIMNNSSAVSSATDLEYYQGQRIAALVIAILVSCAGSYIFIVLTVFEVLVDRPADFMRWLCLAASFLLLWRVAAEFVEIRHGEDSRLVCRHGREFKTLLQSVIISCIYLVLWIRQRGFYKMEALARLSNPIIRGLSFSVVIIMAITSVSTVVLYFVSRAYTNSARGCVVEWSTIWKLLPGIIYFVSTFLFQIILLGLMINPIYQHIRTLNTTGISFNRSEPSKEIILVKRVTTATAIAITTDIICGIVSVFVLTNTYGSSRQLVYDIDMLVSLIVVICSFSDWRTRLVPF